MLRLPGLLSPELLSLRRATVKSCLHRRPSRRGRSGSVSCGGHCSLPSVLVETGFCLCPPGVSGRYEFDFKHDCGPPIFLLWLPLCPWSWVSFFFFFGGFQHSPVNGSLAAICNFSVLTGEDKRVSFYSAMSSMKRQKDVVLKDWKVNAPDW